MGLSLPISWGALFLLAAISVYAVFGSPTPDHYGWAEMVVGGLLVLAVRFPDLKRDGFLLSVASFGLFLPAVLGAIHGNLFSDMIRDMIPFLFLFLVCIYRSYVEELGNRFVWFVAALGFAFSLRSIFSAWEIISLHRPYVWGVPPDLLYLANSPEVLFSALWLLAAAFVAVFQDRAYVRFLVFLGLSFLPILSMSVMMQRAGLGAVLIFVFFFLGTRAFLSWRQFLVVFLFVAGVGMFFGESIFAVIEGLWSKTQMVGLNSRVQEWETVIGLLGRDWNSALFGYGWGARFENPAVGGVSVLYTHSLVSYLLLKTGILGAFVILLGVSSFVFRQTPLVFRNQPLLFWALFFPLLIAGGIYASYKSLGFGLILLIFLAFPHQNLERNKPPVA